MKANKKSWMQENLFNVIIFVIKDHRCLSYLIMVENYKEEQEEFLWTKTSKKGKNQRLINVKSIQKPQNNTLEQVQNNSVHVREHVSMISLRKAI